LHPHKTHPDSEPNDSEKRERGTAPKPPHR
jgi:hypothetical protein